MLTIEKLSNMESDNIGVDAFNSFVENEYNRHEGSATYLEIVADVVEKTGIGYNKASQLLNTVIQEKIKKECIALNLLKDVVKSIDLTKLCG